MSALTVCDEVLSSRKATTEMGAVFVFRVKNNDSFRTNFHTRSWEIKVIFRASPVLRRAILDTPPGEPPLLHGRYRAWEEARTSLLDIWFPANFVVVMMMVVANRGSRGRRLSFRR